MTTSHLSGVEEILEVNQYHLPEADRKRIISESPLAKRMKEIEAMRLDFIEKYGDEFGQPSEKKLEFVDM